MSKEKKTPEERKTEKEDRIRTWVETKIQLAHDWIDNEKTQAARRIIKGAIYKCELGENVGTEQGERRPVLVVSNDLINTTSGNVTVIPLTKNLKTKKNKKGKTVPKYNSHYFLYKSKYTFLEHDSAVLAEEVKTVSKARIFEQMGTETIQDIDPKDFERIMTRVKWVLEI